MFGTFQQILHFNVVLEKKMLVLEIFISNIYILLFLLNNIFYLNLYISLFNYIIQIFYLDKAFKIGKCYVINCNMNKTKKSLYVI